jgi:hypothetical protein
MKDFLKTILVMGEMLALVLGVRVAAYVHLPIDAGPVADAAPAAAADRACGLMAVKFPCFRRAGAQGREAESAPRPSRSAETQPVAAQNARCAVRQVRMPCFQHTELRS